MADWLVQDRINEAKKSGGGCDSPGGGHRTTFADTVRMYRQI